MLYAFGDKYDFLRLRLYALRATHAGYTATPKREYNGCLPPELESEALYASRRLDRSYPNESESQVGSDYPAASDDQAESESVSDSSEQDEVDIITEGDVQNELALLQSPAPLPHLELDQPIAIHLKTIEGAWQNLPTSSAMMRMLIDIFARDWNPSKVRNDEEDLLKRLSNELLVEVIQASFRRRLVGDSDDFQTLEYYLDLEKSKADSKYGETRGNHARYSSGATPDTPPAEAQLQETDTDEHATGGGASTTNEDAAEGDKMETDDFMETVIGP